MGRRSSVSRSKRAFAGSCVLCAALVAGCDGDLRSRVSSPAEGGAAGDESGAAGAVNGGVAESGGAAGGEAPAPVDLYDWQLPPGFPEPAVPTDNPMTAEKVELGRHL